MPATRFPIMGLLLILSIYFFTESQTYSDDSLIVVEILTANGLDTLAVEQVSSTMDDRIYALNLNNFGLQVLPECIGGLSGLVHLHVARNELTTLPQSIGSLSNLVHISIYDNFIYKLPTEFSNLQNLKTIYLIRNRLPSWPEVFHSMPNLEMIDVGGNHLSSIPEEVCSYQSLNQLFINDNYISQLPDRIVELDLDVVHVSGNTLCTVPEEIASWLNERDYHKENSRWLTYQHCNRFFQDSTTVRRLLDENGWTSLTVNSVAEIINGNIVSLDLSFDNTFKTQNLSRQSKTLEHKLHLSSGIDSLKHLRSLNLSGCNIDSIPDWFARLCHLQFLDLSFNRLQTLPRFMASFYVLEDLNLSGNMIESLTPETELWADTHAPDWRSTQINTATIPLESQKPQNLQLSLISSFQNDTKLQITFVHRSFAEVAIFSLSGRKIKTVAKHFEPGTHYLTLGSTLLPRGTYIAHIRRTDISASETLRFFVN